MYGGRVAMESPAPGLPPAHLRLCLQAVPPGSGGRAPEPPLARAQAGPADGAEAAGLSRGLEAGVRTPGGAEDCPQFSQGEGVWAAELGLRPASLTLCVLWGLGWAALGLFSLRLCGARIFSPALKLQ